MQTMTKRTWVIVGILVFLAVGPMLGNTILGGDQTRCVGVDASREVVKARGEKCYKLDQAMFFELGDDGQVQVSGDTRMEFGQ